MLQQVIRCMNAELVIFLGALFGNAPELFDWLMQRIHAESTPLLSDYSRRCEKCENPGVLG